MIESERKFIVDEEDLPDKLLSGRSGRTITQFYLAVGPETEVRVRKRVGEELLQIKKGGISEEREEMTFKIPVQAGEFIKDLIASAVGVVEKTRYNFGNGIILDDFKNRDLMLLEIENSDEDPPEWAGREVTGEPAYYNRNLMEPNEDVSPLWG